MSRKRKILTLAERVAVLKKVDQGMLVLPGMNMQTLMLIFPPMKQQRKDWEDKLLDRVIARRQDSTLSSNEEDIDDGSGPIPIVSAITAAGYLDQLRDFEFAHQIPELLEYVSKSKAVVEYSMCKKRVKQTN